MSFTRGDRQFTMTTVTADIAVSLDGFAAGPNQSADLPFGEGVDGRLHTWMFDNADDNREEIEAITSAGAYIMGRTMFGSGRDDVQLRHGPAGVRVAQARQAAGGGHVAIAGGAATLNQYLSLGAVDELRLHVVPLTLGAGERIFDGSVARSTPFASVRPSTSPR
jgi:dihydrofolate reductase